MIKQCVFCDGCGTAVQQEEKSSVFARVIDIAVAAVRGKTYCEACERKDKIIRDNTIKAYDLLSKAAQNSNIDNELKSDIMNLISKQEC